MFSRKFVIFFAHFIVTVIVLMLLCISFPDTILRYYSNIANFILYLLVASLTYNFSKNLFCGETLQPHNKAVLITGCDSGCGKMLAKQLDARGFQVFASCLFPEGEGAKELIKEGSDRLHMLYLDVTKQESVEKALCFVEQNLGSNILWAVVNNAGLFKSFHVEFTSLQCFKDVMEVNAFGQVRVSKAFLPLLKKSKGRIVNVTSLAGRLSLPGPCAYIMSKHAAKAFTECLSQDLNVWGIRVISIEPDFIRTPMVDGDNVKKSLDLQFSTVSEDILTSYGDEYFRKLKEITLKILRMAPNITYKVVNDIELAITREYPNRTYKPRRNLIASLLIYFTEIMPYGFYENCVLRMIKLLGLPTPKAVKLDVSN